MIHAILNPLTKSDLIVYQTDCQFIKARNLLPVFPEIQHSIMTAHDSRKIVWLIDSCVGMVNRYDIA